MPVDALDARLEVVRTELNGEINWIRKNEIYFHGQGLADLMVRRIQRRLEKIEFMLIVEEEEKDLTTT